MAESKWNIAAVNVHGQAMFGDGNRMEVRASTTDSPQIEVLLQRLKEALDAIPEHGNGSLSPAERFNAHAAIGELTQEVKKKPAEQDRGLLTRSIDRISGVLKIVPSAVSTALSIKSLLGL